MTFTSKQRGNAYFDKMGLANQVALPPQFLSDMVRHIEQGSKDVLVQPRWVKEVTSNGLSATLDSVGTLVIQVFIAASNSNWRHALRIGTAFSLVM